MEEIHWEVGAVKKKKVYIMEGVGGGGKSARRNIRDLCSVCFRDTEPEMHRLGVLRSVACKLSEQLRAPLNEGGI